MRIVGKIGFWLMVVAALSIAVNLLNRWHPVMGLGDVLYFVIAGVILGIAFGNPASKPSSKGQK